MMSPEEERALADKAKPSVAAHLAGAPMSPELVQWIEHINELEKTAPHGRCELCGGALTAIDAQAYGGKYHINCANDHYGE